MKLPKILGQVIYFFGYPIVRLAIFKSTRAYVLITYKDEALLTVDWLSFRHQQRLPGGGVKHREDPLEAAKREVYEEIGLIIDTNSLKPITDQPIHSKKHFKYYVYTLNINEKPTLRTKDLDVLYTNWVKRQDVGNLLLGEEAITALKAKAWL